MSNLKMIHDEEEEGGGIPASQKAAIIGEARRRLGEYDNKTLKMVWSSIQSTDWDPRAPSPIPKLRMRGWIKCLQVELQDRNLI